MKRARPAICFLALALILGYEVTVAQERDPYDDREARDADMRPVARKKARPAGGQVADAEPAPPKCPEGFEPETELGDDNVCSTEWSAGEVQCEDIYNDDVRLLLHVTLEAPDQEEPHTVDVIDLGSLRSLIADGEWIGACETWRQENMTEEERKAEEGEG